MKVETEHKKNMGIIEKFKEIEAEMAWTQINEAIVALARMGMGMPKVDKKCKFLSPKADKKCMQLQQIVPTIEVLRKVVIAFSANWILAFVILVLLPLVGLNGYIQLKFMKGFNVDAKMMYEEASQVANNAVGSIRTVASFCAEKKARTRIASTVKAIVDERIGNGEVQTRKLKDGSLVAIRCLKLKNRHTIQNFSHEIELISKHRHRDLVNALGHRFKCYLDDSSVSRIFIIFEYVPNGPLRDRISGK
ncbi:hypothetical protein Syun_020963 [Stephania yunnanensis]|uniref:Protein kinase domain-containing protein n=1 Tax=Stephania yunnanensis TaxID=152371 RepID=A0AAP0IG48_9MAGN